MDSTPNHSWSLSLHSDGSQLSSPKSAGPKLRPFSQGRRLLTDVVQKVLLQDSKERGGFTPVTKVNLQGGRALSPAVHFTHQDINLSPLDRVNLDTGLLKDVQNTNQIKIALKQLQYVVLLTTLSKHSTLQQQISLMMAQHKLMQRRLQQIEEQTFCLKSSIARLCDRWNKQQRQEVQHQQQTTLQHSLEEHRLIINEQLTQRTVMCWNHGVLTASGCLLMTLYLGQHHWVRRLVQRLTSHISSPKHRKWMRDIVHLVLTWEILLLIYTLSGRLKPFYRLQQMISIALSPAVHFIHVIKNLLFNGSKPGRPVDKSIKVWDTCASPPAV